ncbi:hypothetical protein HW932_00455 [Allochromatium humboldtianum]|uniref:Uncharacterized protein n=1 Tax=Allochromatium humboldtianum TaxID=504901 RepID=A0A850R2Y6_9GAMM|nr:hypothetical protein [Allochromatium humboldtianum]NVZ07728.1 hypothetical protein [Allochromatium humboldtianum]
MAVVGLAFANTLGSAANLSPDTNPNDPVSLVADPAYRASVKAISDVTEEMATRVRYPAFYRGYQCAMSTFSASWQAASSLES